MFEFRNPFASRLQNVVYFHGIIIMERDYKRLEHNSAEVGAWERSQRSRARHITL